VWDSFAAVSEKKLVSPIIHQKKSHATKLPPPTLKTYSEEQTKLNTTATSITRSRDNISPAKSFEFS
jgi:hypothetical protein